MSPKEVRPCGSERRSFPRPALQGPVLGDVEIYRKEVRFRVPAQSEGRFDLKVTSQGCADIGVCYVPMDSRASLVLAASGSGGDARDASEAPSLSIFASDFEIARLFEGGYAFVGCHRMRMRKYCSMQDISLGRVE